MHTIERPFERTTAQDLAGLHTELAFHHRTRHARHRAALELSDDLDADIAMQKREDLFIYNERQRVSFEAKLAAASPANFGAWWDGLAASGAGHDDPFLPWLAQSASWDAVRWFLRQEIAAIAPGDRAYGATGPTGFGAPTGFGGHSGIYRRSTIPPRQNAIVTAEARLAAAHHRSARLLQLGAHFDVRDDQGSACWEALSLSNLRVALASNRRYAWHNVGAQCIEHMTQPTAWAHISHALHRLETPAGFYRDVAESALATLDADRGWYAELLAGVAHGGVDVVRSIAEGALMRLEVGARCTHRYRATLCA